MRITQTRATTPRAREAERERYKQKKNVASTRPPIDPKLLRFIIIILFFFIIFFFQTTTIHRQQNYQQKIVRRFRSSRGLLLRRHANAQERILVRGNPAERRRSTRSRELGTAVFFNLLSRGRRVVFRFELETEHEFSRLGERRSPEEVGRGKVERIKGREREREICSTRANIIIDELFFRERERESARVVEVPTYRSIDRSKPRGYSRPGLRNGAQTRCNIF